MDVSTLLDRLSAATAARKDLLEALAAEGTDCMRLLHGVTEDMPGVAIDRYGPVLLAQTWAEALPEGAIEALEQWSVDTLGEELVAVWNHRADRREPAPHRELPELVLGHEAGLTLDVSPRQRGADPLLYLDLRSGRRRVQKSAAGCSVLNLFSYTCTLGVAAAMGGASEVVNVDFSGSALEIGLANAERNGIAETVFTTVQEDFFPAARQLAGLGVQDRRRGRSPRFKRMKARTFDMVLLDPPRWAKSRFGAVDVVRDYASLFKPSVLCTRPGGVVMATNHVHHVEEEAWISSLHRCAEKAGRPLIDIELVRPDADFPSPDSKWPLKIAWCRVS